MQLDFETRAARYIMEWGEWIEKLQLLALLGFKFERAKIYVEKLIKLQNQDGGFPRNWIKGRASSLLETATALELLAKMNFREEVLEKAAKYLVEKQLANGSWREEKEEYGERRAEKHRVTLETARILRALASFDAKNAGIEKAIAYLAYAQREDGLWLTSHLDESVDMEASSEAILALLEVGSEKAKQLARIGVEALWRWFVEKATEDWSEMPKEALSIAEALIEAGYGEAEAVRRILKAYVKAEKWRFGDKRSISTSEAVKALKVLLLAKAIDEEKVRREVERLIYVREELKRKIEAKEEETRNYFLIRFEEIGIRPSDKPSKILLGSYLYAMMDQFFWTSEAFDPQKEYREIVGLIGSVDQIDKYMDFENVKKAFFKSRALRGIARRRKLEVAKSISLFAKFIKEYGNFKDFKEFAEKLRAYTLFKVAPQVSGWNTAYNLGLLLRSFSKAENDLGKLIKSFELSLKCFPAVGAKIALLFPFYALWVFRLWPEASTYIKCPIDWNIVKPYGNLGLSCMTLKELRKDPKRAAEAIHRLAEELFPEDPAKIVFLWIVGHEWCTKPYKCYGIAGRKCWIFDLCARGRTGEGKKNMG
mgnify:CR=1 FL=1